MTDLDKAFFAGAFLAVVLAGCVGQAPAAVSSACAWDKIIHPAAADTMLTLRQIDEHNKGLRLACPGL